MRINDATVNINVGDNNTVSIPPTLIYKTDTSTIVCPLSVTPSTTGNYSTWSGVYGTPDSLFKIVISPTEISTFELRVTE
jgi:hypothetical protein